MIQDLCTVRHCALVAMLMALWLASWSSEVSADPVLTVSDLGLNGSLNREWMVEVAADPTLFTGGMGSLDVELAFEVTGSELVGATLNAAPWPFANPGNNPFTGTTTLGLQNDLAEDTVFASFGSDPFTDGNAVHLLTIETLGSGSTTLSWGGHTLLDGTAFAYIGSRIAQAGTNFDGYMGSLMSSDNPVTGDFNDDGSWDCLDIDALTNAVATGSTDLAFDMNGDGSITFADVDEAGTGWLAVGGANNPGVTGGNPFLVADATLDGNVDGQDFVVWNNGKFTMNTAWCDGNFNGDLNIDGQDFVAWNTNKFTSSDVQNVPEPSTSVLLVMFGIALMALAHRQRTASLSISWSSPACSGGPLAQPVSNQRPAR